MSTPITMILLNSTYDSGNSFSGQSYLWLATKPGLVGTAYSGRTSVQHPSYALVLNRKDPMGPALYEGLLDNNTDVPQALADVLTPDGILIFTTSAMYNDVPQGALFSALQQSGGAGKLARLEALATHISCGFLAEYTYALIGVPGTGLPGIETDQSEFTAMTLAPGPDGYAPVKIG